MSEFCGDYAYYLSECVVIIHEIKPIQITVMPTQVIKSIRVK